MLELPKSGVRRSVSSHNSDIELFCDWLEANVLIENDSLSFSDVIDRLIEEQYYDSQDFAWNFLSTAVSVLAFRARNLQRAYPFSISDARLELSKPPNGIGAYGFCLALSIVPTLATNALTSNWSEQGLLLEKLTEAALQESLPMWGIYRTGWSGESANNLPKIAALVAEYVDASVGEPEIFSKGKAKDAGLDVLCYRPYPDGRGGYSCMMVQCASGANWKRKRKEPDLALWRRAVTFDNPPARALVIPFAIGFEEMRESSVRVEGLVIDRIRLLQPGREGRPWLSKELDTELLGWWTSLAPSLPRLN